MKPFAALLLVTLPILAYMWFKSLRPAVEQVPRRFFPKDLLTANEKDFLMRLRAAVPELTVMAQVSMGALMSGRQSSGNGLQARAKFAQKIVDFVLLDASFDVLLLVELDDRTHDEARDAERDAMTAEAGYATLRVASKGKPEPARLRALILKKLTSVR